MSTTIFLLTIVLAIIGSYEDIKGYMISKRTLYFGCMIVAIKLMMDRNHIQILYGALAGSIILYIVALLSNGGIGGGDIKIMAIYGAILGANYIMLAQLIGLCLALLGALVTRKIRARREIWLVPFLSIGVILVYIPSFLSY